MKALNRKLARDLWAMKTQVVSIALVIACGIGAFIAGGCAKSTPIRRAIIGGTTPSIESWASCTTRVSTSETPGMARICGTSVSGARFTCAKTCGKRALS